MQTIFTNKKNIFKTKKRGFNMSKKTFLRTILAAAFLLLMASGNSWAAAISWDDGAGDGLWGSAANWSGDVLPGPNDDVTIGAYTVYLNVDASIKSLTLSSATSFLYPYTSSSNTITLTGNLTFGNAGAAIVYNNGNGKLNLNFAGTAAQTVTLLANAVNATPVGLNVYNITVADNSSVTVSGNFSFNIYGNLTVNGTGTVTYAYNAAKIVKFLGTNPTVTIGTDATVTLSNVVFGDGILSTIGTWSGSATIPGSFTNSLNSKFTQTSGTLTFTNGTGGAAACIVNSATSNYDMVLYNVDLNGTSDITPATSFTIAGNLVNTVGANAASAGTIYFKNTATPHNPKTITVSGGSLTFFNVKIDDASYVQTGSSISVIGTGGTAFEVIGSGSFKQTAGTVTFTGASAAITTTGNSVCQFYNLTLGNGADAYTTSSNFTVLNDFTIGNALATFTASAPSIITFDNSTFAGGDGAGTITSTANNAITFNSVVVAENSSIAFAGAFITNIKGDVTVGNKATMDWTGANTTANFSTATTKNIYNYGTLTFYDFTVASTAGNVVQTESDFTVNDIFTVGANGQFVASGNSTVTLALAGVSPVNTTQANLKFQNVKFTAAAVPASPYVVKGDFICNAAYDATAGDVLFQGTSQQTIKGSTAPKFWTITLNNAAGLKLEQNIELQQTGATVLTLTTGSIDLNGNHSILLSGNAPVISEDYDNGYLVTNSSETPGYIEYNDAGDAGLIASVTGSGIGISSITAAGDDNAIADIIARRYVAAKYIDGVKTVNRYYYILPDDGAGTDAITDISLEYSTSELNGNTEDNLSGYLVANSVSNPTTITGDRTTGWESVGGTVTAAVSPSTLGSLAISTISSGLTDATAYIFGIKGKTINLTTWPNTFVSPTLATATMPIVAGNTSQKLMRFALKSDASATLTKIVITSDNILTGVLSNLVLKYYTNINTPGVSTDFDPAVSVSGTTLTAVGSLSMTAGTDYYFVLEGDVSSAVTSATQHITFSLGTNGLTASNFTFTGSAVSSPEISFTGQVVSVSPNNTPLSAPVSQGTSNYAFYGFTLTPPANTPTITINSVRVKVNFSDGAVTGDFSGYDLYKDNNKNGIVDGADAALQSSVTLTADGYLNFNSLANNTFTTETNYLVRADVLSTATVGGKISMSIESYNDIQLQSPATIVSGGPYDGGTFTVADQTITPTRLVVTSFGMDNYSKLLTDLPIKTGREIVSGEALNITVEAQDGSGNPAPVTSNTQVSVSILSGSATVANGTATITSGSVNINWATLTLTNALGYSPITIQVTPVSGMVGLTPATYNNIVLYADENAAITPALTIGTTTTTTIALSWTNAGSDDVLLVARENTWPVDPQDGMVYDQVPANDFSATSGSGNYFTGTGSVVVYKGTGTGVTVTGLTPGKTYYFALYPYNGGAISTSKPNYYTVEVTDNKNYAKTLTAEPTVAPTSLTFTQVTTSSIKMNWTNGNGEKRIVVAYLGSAPTATPVDSVTYTANSAYGDPNTVIPGGTGYVVYNGNSNTVTVTNLLPNSRYYFVVYEYNGSGIYTNYYTTGASGNRYTLATEPTVQAHNISFAPQTPSLANNTQLILSWVRGNGDGCIVLAKAGAPIAAAENPVDQANTDDYTANAAFGAGDRIGDAYVVHSGTANTVTVTGLLYGETYYFKVYEYNNGNGTNTAYATSTINYLTSDATGNPSYAIADSYESNDVMSKANYITSDGTLYTGIISNASDVDWFSIEPDVAGGNNNLRIKLMNLPKDYKIELYNSDGRRLRSSNFSNLTDEVMVINNIPAGTYYIKVITSNGDFSITPYRINVLETSLEYKSETP
jgi:hypothetical protein